MAYLQTYPHQNAAIRSFSIESELILFDDFSKELALLNQTASEIWNLHRKKLSVDEITKCLSKRYGLLEEEIISDVALIFEEWLNLGFIGDKIIANDLSDDKKLFSLKYKSRVNIDKLKNLHCGSFQYLDSSFCINASSVSILKIIIPIISHLRETGSSSNTHEVTIHEVGNRFEFVKLGKVLATCDSLNEIAPIINAFILITGYQEADNLSVFHAGAISDDNGVVLLSGSPGSGKSTLVAALMCLGKKVFTDEVSILTHDKKIRPAPGVIGLKEGSWDVIEGFLPSITAMPIHLRQDDKVVKYIQPCNLLNNNQLKYGEPVKAIVFPVYSQEFDTHIEKISSAEALVRLTKAGYYTSQTLSTNTVTELIAWIHDIPAFELQINDLKSAADLVAELL